ncbi:hypothetical protein [Streptomyces sp. WAC08241]|uniref:hypothetical protein n=1 Tax=Streptomyces sp. WAC08241 TaxID=2487421 RepID=UPI00163CA0E1|nr:hypothetical protein [Streptomyces sp. WAC08241]
MSRLTSLLAAAGLALLFSAGAATAAHAAGAPVAGDGVIGWDSVRAAAPAHQSVIGWD